MFTSAMASSSTTSNSRYNSNSCKAGEISSPAFFFTVKGMNLNPIGAVTGLTWKHDRQNTASDLNLCRDRGLQDRSRQESYLNGRTPRDSHQVFGRRPPAAGSSRLLIPC